MPKASQVFTKLALAGCLLSLSVAATAQCTFHTLTIPGSTNSSAIGINDKGAIVGGFLDTAAKSHGYLLFNGHFAKFSFPGATSTEALDINNSGVIVGDFVNSAGQQHGFRVQNGVFHSISVPGTSATRALGVNNFGTIVGEASGPTGDSGFVLHGRPSEPLNSPVRRELLPPASTIMA
jgi:probable HAF family extracellular repeat protein